MEGTEHHAEFRDLSDRLARLEERGISRDDRMERMEVTLVRLANQVEGMANDLRDAKTGLRVGMWISSTVVPAIAAAVGWFAHVLWPMR
jgi:hypothetical protein